MQGVLPTATHPDVQQAYGGPGRTGQAQAPNQAAQAGAGHRGPSFSEVLEGAYDAAKTQLSESQTAAMKAATGDANVQQVAEAVTEAQVTVQTMTTLRDRAVQAYQSILRMPI